jgi:hypothetical protein
MFFVKDISFFGKKVSEQSMWFFKFPFEYVLIEDFFYLVKTIPIT